MKLIHWGMENKARRKKALDERAKRAERNRELIQQQVRLPSGAIYTLCKAVAVE